jgi:PmbA protein
LRDYVARDGEMFAHLTPANDLRFRRGADAPTVRVEG